MKSLLSSEETGQGWMEMGHVPLRTSSSSFNYNNSFSSIAESPHTSKEHAQNGKRRKSQRMARGRGVMKQKARRLWDKFESFDQFAVDLVPPSRIGGFATVIVWLATLIYLIILVVQWVKSPPIVTSNALWSIGSGPFMMRMQCHARSGCLLSNKLSYESTEGVSDMVNQTFIDGCVRVPHLETLQMPLVYSINPFEGVSALYDPSTSDDEVLPRYGVTAASETMCKPYKGKGCVKVRESQIGPGVGSVMYVQIHNQTETGDAKHRQEFFAATSTMNETVNSKTTACVPDPGWTETAQARLTMGSFYFDVLVRRDSFWMYLWGTAGGAYGSFFEVAALLLVLSSLAVKVYQNRLKSTQLMQATQSLRLPIFSHPSNNQEKSPNAVMPG